MRHRAAARLALTAVLAATLGLAGSARAASATKTYLFLFDSQDHKHAQFASVGAKLRRDYKLIPAFAAELTADEASALKSRAAGLVSMEEDQTYHAMAGGSQVTPYGIDMVGAPAAWATTKGAGAKVAVLDTGIDLNHPDHGSVILTTSFIAGETVADGNGHGTHTSGTVAALDNTEGVVGVAPEASLLIGKVLSNAGSGPTSGIAAGIDWAVANGANVISMSLGGPGFSAVMKASVDAAVAAGVTVVAASGNAGDDSKSYPAAYPNSISVAAVDSTATRAPFSQYGSTIDISGPGVDVLSTVPLGTGAGDANANWSSTDHQANGLTGTASSSVSGGVYYCGIGDGTAGNTCPAGVAGNIAHIRRGTISFADKVLYAQSVGAAGVIISNNVTGNFFGTGAATPLVAVSISQEDGDALAALGDGTAATISVGPPQDYAKFSGTSMAAPHVAGVAALLYSCGGVNATPAKVRNALQNTATDLGDAGRDDFYGNGLVQAPEAVTQLCSGGCRSTIAAGSAGFSSIDLGWLFAPVALMFVRRRIRSAK